MEAADPKLWEIVVGAVAVGVWQYLGARQFDESQLPDADDTSVRESIGILKAFGMHLLAGPFAGHLPPDLTTTFIQRERNR